MNQTILVTGGCGYIGSHTIAELVGAGYNVVVLDNLYNSTTENIKILENYYGITIPIFIGDYADIVLLDKIFKEYNIQTIFHFAGLKSISESHKRKRLYFTENVEKLDLFLKYLSDKPYIQFLFPSSAATYRFEPNSLPYSEDSHQKAESPYAQNKIDGENLLKNYAKNNFKVTILRYSNPLGANSEIGLSNKPITNKSNLLTYIMGHLYDPEFVFEFKRTTTIDGFGIRDYIHIMDIAKSNLVIMQTPQNLNFEIFNISTEHGSSVKDIVTLVENITHQKINFKLSTELSNEQPESVVCNKKAVKQFHISLSHSLEDMIESEISQNLSKF